jgi:hypothetical protein
MKLIFRVALSGGIWPGVKLRPPFIPKGWQNRINIKLKRLKRERELKRVEDTLKQLPIPLGTWLADAKGTWQLHDKGDLMGGA